MKRSVPLLFRIDALAKKAPLYDMVGYRLFWATSGMGRRISMERGAERGAASHEAAT